MIDLSRLRPCHLFLLECSSLTLTFSLFYLGRVMIVDFKLKCLHQIIFIIMELNRLKVDSKFVSFSYCNGKAKIIVLILDQWPRIEQNAQCATIQYVDFHLIPSFNINTEHLCNGCRRKTTESRMGVQQRSMASGRDIQHSKCYY